MHFGLEPFVGGVLYAGAIFAVLLSIFWRPIAGIFFLLPLIPLQTVRYRMGTYPLGHSMLTITLAAVAIGLLRRRQCPLPRSPWTALLTVYGLYNMVSLFVGSAYLSAPLPLPGEPRFGVFLDYMLMPALLLLVAAVQPTPRQMKAMVLLMCLSILQLDRGFWATVRDRDYSTYTDNLRDEQEAGAMGYAGANGMAAFTAQAACFLLAMAGFERSRKLKLGYWALIIYTVLCLIYALSRGGYAAFIVGCLFIALVKRPKFLVLITVLGLTWTSWAPVAVQERIRMTYDPQSGELDHSTGLRLTLWEDAKSLVSSNPLMGTGFNTYAYMHRVGDYEDTHNYYVKVLVETGAVGLTMLLCFMGLTFWNGYSLSRRARDPFLASLGMGLCAWLVTASVASVFGDRWTFLQVNGYMWVLGGMVSQALRIERYSEDENAESTPDVVGKQLEEVYAVF